MQYQYPLSAEMGAVNNTSFYNLVENEGFDRLSDWLGAEDAWYGRLARTVILDWPLAFYLGGVDHEIYGHGFRSREAGCSVEHNLRPWDGGFGQGENTECPEDRDIADRIMGAAGGLEATQVMADYIAEQMLVGGGDIHSAMLYIDTKLDISNYILLWNNPTLSEFVVSASTLGHFTEDTGNVEMSGNGDIYSYWMSMGRQNLNSLADRYGMERVYHEHLWQGPDFSFFNIYAGAAWNMADPLLFYSFFQLGRYIFAGDKDFEIPDFLPRTNFVLSPNGPQYGLRLPFRVGEVVFDPYINSTFNYGSNTVGLGIDIYNLRATERLTLNLGWDFWVQSGGEEAALAGTAVEIEGTYEVLEWLSLGLGLRYKSEGYIMGQRLDDGLDWWVFSTFTF